MSRVTGLLQSPVYQTEQERAAPPPQGPGLIDTITGAAELGWITSSFVRWGGRELHGRQYDPNFRITDDFFEDIPPRLWSAFEDATSWSDAQYIRQSLLQRLETEEQLGRHGWVGSAAILATSLLDPVNFISFGATAPFTAARAGGRIAQMVRGGLVTGGVSASLVGVQAQIEPDVTWRDAAWAGVAGFTFHQGATLAGVGLSKAADRVKRASEAQEIVAAMGAAAGRELQPEQFHDLIKQALTEKGAAYFKDVTDPEIHRQRVHEMIDTLDIDDDVRATLKSLPPSQVINQLERPEYRFDEPGMAADEPPPVVTGAAATSPPPTGSKSVTPGNTFPPPPAPGPPGPPSPVLPNPPTPAGGAAGTPPAGAPPAPPPPPRKLRGDYTADNVTDDPAVWTKARMSFAAIFGSEKNTTPGVRILGSSMVEDALLKKSGGKVQQAASEWVDKTNKIFLARYYRVAETAIRDWAESTNQRINRFNELVVRDTFFRNVSHAIRSPNTINDPNIIKVANLQGQLLSELRKMGQRHNVKGFANIPENLSYLPRIWNVARITLAEKTHSSAEVANLISRAIQQGSRGMAPADADQLAAAFIKVVKSKDQWTDVDAIRMFSEDGTEMMVDAMQRNGVAPDVIERIVYDVVPPGKRAEKGMSARAKRRLDIDESAYIRTAKGMLTVQDLLEENAETLMGLYSHQILGASAEAAILKRMNTHFNPTGAGAPLETFSAVKSRIGAEMRDAGHTKEHIDDMLEKLELAHRAISGKSMHPDKKYSKMLRTIRAYNHINLSGSFGMAQIADAGNMIGEFGFKAMLQQMPALRQIFKRAQNGTLTNEMMEFAELMNGLGTDRLTRQLVQRLDEGSALNELGGGGLERRLRQGTRIANDLSGMAPINIVLQRGSAVLAAQKLTNIARSGKPLSAKRFASLGLDQADMKDIAAQIRQHANPTQGWTGGKLLDPNINAWDPDVAAKFIYAIDKWSRRAVQQTDIGQLLPFMTTDVGKTIFQFRSFAVAAWEKQLLSRVQMFDRTAFMGMLWGSFVAGLTYVAQKNLESVGRHDVKEFREKHLNTGAVIKAAVQRGAWASILPGAIDSVWGATGGDPIFNARNSGLKGNWLEGNPSINLIREAHGAVRAAGKLVRPGVTMTDQDARHMTNLIPYRRLMGFQNAIEHFNTSFPKRGADE